MQKNPQFDRVMHVLNAGIAPKDEEAEWVNHYLTLADKAGAPEPAETTRLDEKASSSIKAA